MALVAFVVIGAHWTWTRLRAAPMAGSRRSPAVTASSSVLWRFFC